jgi:hypothetical protein
MPIFRGHVIWIPPGYLEKRDRIFQLMGMSLRVGETAA